MKNPLPFHCCQAISSISLISPIQPRMPSAWLLSTLEAYFEGKKELFEGLEIEKLETDLTPHPILHIDLNTQKHDTPESLEKILDEQRPR